MQNGAPAVRRTWPLMIRMRRAAENAGVIGASMLAIRHALSPPDVDSMARA